MVAGTNAFFLQGMTLKQLIHMLIILILLIIVMPVSVKNG